MHHTNTPYSEGIMTGHSVPTAASEDSAESDLDALVREVARCRQQTTVAHAALSAAKRQFEEDTAPLLTHLNAARARQEAAEELLRQAALVTFAATGSKRPHPALGVRLLVHLSYDKDAITTWARTNLPGVLVLDTRTFEQVAPRLRVPGVTVHEEPQATIAQDLTAWEPGRNPL